MTAMNSLFHETAMRSSQWVGEVMTALELDDDRKGIRAVRAGLHAIRDRLPDAEVVDLAAQLPMLLRGLYYEGWQPGRPPPRLHSRDELLDVVGEYLEWDATLDPEAVLRAVIRMLAWHVSPGELDDVAGTLPRPLAELWNESCG